MVLAVGSSLAVFAALLPGGASAAPSAAESMGGVPMAPFGHSQPGAFPPLGVTPPATDGGAISGEVIVAFEQGATGSRRASVRRSQRATVKVTTPALPDVQLLDLPRGLSVSAAVKAFERSPSVRYAQPNHVVQAAIAPNDTHFASQWGLHNTGQTPPYVSQFHPPVTAGTPDADIDAIEAWDLTTGGTGVTVAIVDSGVAYNHPDLAPNTWTNPGESGGGKETNLVDDDSNGYVDDWHGWDFVTGENDPFDEHSHGTHVAGIVGAAAGNGYGTSGVSPTVRLMPVRVLDSAGLGSVYSVAAGMAYAADRGAQIVNLSLGGADFGDNLERDVIRQHPGVLFAAAAMNSGADRDTSSFRILPCQIPEDNVMCVAATDHDDQLASFSNYGRDSVDIAAPGADVLSAFSLGIPWWDLFDTPINGRWTTGGTNNTWAATGELGDDGSLTDSPGANYLNGTDSFAERSANLTGMSQCTFRFGASWALGDDGATLEISDGSSPPSYARSFSGTSGTEEGIDLSSLEGRPNVRFRFRLTSNGAGADDGIHVSYASPQCRRRSGYDSQSFVYLSGTSMATPTVAGAAALLRAYRPNATVAQVNAALLDGTDQLASLAGKTVSGGRLNARTSLSTIDGVMTRGRIIVRQDSRPDHPQDFAFTTGGGLSPATFSLDDHGDATLPSSRVFRNLTPGSGYSISQQVPSGWQLSSAICNDGSPVSNIAVSAGEIVTCTFTDESRGQITVVKDAIPNDPQDFDFTGGSSTGGDLDPASFQLDDDSDSSLSNTRTFSVLIGTYSVSEAVPTGWIQQSATCDDGSSPSSIEVSAGEHVTCTFVNSKGYPRPRAGAQFRVPLALAYAECGDGRLPNEVHGLSLAGPSCNPPTPESSWLTVGTSDANGFSAQGVGFVKATTCVTGTTAAGTCSLPLGMSSPDVRLETSLTDVRCKVGSPSQSSCQGGPLSDYLGHLETSLTIRMTDRSNGPAGGPYAEAGTVADISIAYAVPCQVNSGGGSPAAIGASCSVITRANAVVPGAVAPAQRAIWEMAQVRVLDGGADGDISTAGDTVFGRQGVFVP